MPDIDPNYASPNLRWALLLEDHPGATYAFESAAGDVADVPYGWGAEEEHCVCTITFPETSGLAPVRAQKAVAEVLEVRRSGKNVTLERTSELWAKLCTMTLGRALKRAGYPDNMNELKGLMLWRRRIAEVEQVAAGVKPAGELPPGADKVLDKAAHVDEEAAAADRDSTAAAGGVMDLPSEEVHVDPIMEALNGIDEAYRNEAADRVAAVLEQNDGDVEAAMTDLYSAMGALSKTVQSGVNGRLRGLKLQRVIANPQDIDEITLAHAVIYEIVAAVERAPEAAG